MGVEEEETKNKHKLTFVFITENLTHSICPFFQSILKVMFLHFSHDFSVTYFQPAKYHFDIVREELGSLSVVQVKLWLIMIAPASVSCNINATAAAWFSVKCNSVSQVFDQLAGQFSSN